MDRDDDLVGELRVGLEPRKLTISAAAAKILSTNDDILMHLFFHNTGDWGESFENFYEDYIAVLKDDVKQFSTFRTSKGQEFWIITKPDLSINLILPHEYALKWKSPPTLLFVHG